MGMDTFRPNHHQPTVSNSAPLDGVIAKVERGYDFASFVTLAKRLDIAQAQLADVLGISASTLQRRRDGVFNVAESGRIYQLEGLATLVEQVIGDAHDARRWLSTPNPDLGTAPLDLARTAPGLEAVKRHLEQIADGVYL